MTERRVFLLSFGALAILAVMSVVWYQERMLFVDPSFIAFEIIHTKSLMISDRYGSFVTQLFPYISVSLGLSLKTVLIAYSVSFYVFYLTVVACLGWWRQYALGLLMVLYLTLIVSDVYFWTNNEIHQAVGWMLLFLGLYQRFREERISLLVHIMLIVLLMLATVTHLLVAAPLLFLWVYLGLSSADRIGHLLRKRWVGYTFAILAAIGLRYYLSTAGMYDSIKLRGMAEVSFGSIVNTFSSGHALTISRRALTDYWPIFPVFCLGIYGLIRTGRWVLIPLTVAALLVYFILVCLTYSAAYDRYYLAYFESEWMAWGMILATPFAVHYLPRLRWWSAVALVTVVIGVRFFYINQSSVYFETRLHNLITLTEELEKLPGGKVVLPASDDWTKEYFGFNWGLPTETALLSALNNRPVTTTLKNSPPAGTDVSNGQVFLGDFHNVAIPTLDTTYFRFGAEPYHELTPNEADRIRKKLIPLPE